MTLKERQRVLEVCRRHWKGVLVNGISSNNVADTLQLLRHAQQHAHESDQVSSRDPERTFGGCCAMRSSTLANPTR